MAVGKVYLLGAGPGDPQLVTLKAVRCLKAADVVVYDHLAHPDLLRHARRKAEMVFAGKYPRRHHLTQSEINRLLVAQARKGRIVARLKGGDPLLFGRGAEEALALAAAGIPFEIVPGVSSATSVPAYAGIPPTYRHLSSRLTIVTGHETPEKGAAVIDWKKLADPHGTLVILMGMAHLEKIMARIARARRCAHLPAAVITQGATPSQRVVTGTVSDIAARAKAAGLSAPGIIVVGEVVRLRKRLAWFRGPLEGRRVLVTRPRHQAGDMARALESRGARVTAIPLIWIRPLDRCAAVRQTLERIGGWDRIIFTSVNGVELFLKAVKRCHGDLEILRPKSFAAIGSKTAAGLKAAGLDVDIIPTEFVQEALAVAIISHARRGERMLLVHAQGSRPVLERRLRQAGFEVKGLELYRSEPLPGAYRRVRGLLEGGRLDAVMLTSSSCVDSFAAVFGRHDIRRGLNGAAVAVIGPVSAATARRSGIPVAVESRVHTIEGVIEALGAHFSRRGGA